MKDALLDAIDEITKTSF
jgi:hypothetical protein